MLPCVFYSVIAAGGIYSAASTGSTPQELSRQITQGHASLIITSVDCQAVAEKAAREAGLAPESIVIVDSTGGKQRLLDHDGKDLLPFNRTLDWEVITDKQVLQDRPVALVYSSGTTGEPKGAWSQRPVKIRVGRPIFGLHMKYFRRRHFAVELSIPSSYCQLLV